MNTRKKKRKSEFTLNFHELLIIFIIPYIIHVHFFIIFLFLCNFYGKHVSILTLVIRLLHIVIVMCLLASRSCTFIQKNPYFSLCCLNGRVSLPAMQPTPPILDFLYNPSNGSASKTFLDNIRAYNSMFAFTSMGIKIDTSINDQPAPYIYSR